MIGSVPVLRRFRRSPFLDRGPVNWQIETSRADSMVPEKIARLSSFSLLLLSRKLMLSISCHHRVDSNRHMDKLKWAAAFRRNPAPSLQNFMIFDRFEGASREDFNKDQQRRHAV